MRARRTNDRIRELCARLAASKEPDEVNVILPELQSAIHEAIEQLRLRAIAVFSGHPDLANERRKTP